MNIETYKSLNLRKGTIHQIHWKRVLTSSGDVRVAFKGRVEKETIGNFRIGIDYSNMSINKDKITGSLPYGFFEYSNEILYSPSTNTYQLRLTQTMNKNLKPKVKWYLDGEETTKEALIEMGALGANQRKEEPFNPIEHPVFNIKMESIIEIK